jgi:hypothetical protein
MGTHPNHAALSLQRKQGLKCVFENDNLPRPLAMGRESSPCWHQSSDPWADQRTLELWEGTLGPLKIGELPRKFKCMLHRPYQTETFIACFGSLLLFCIGKGVNHLQGPHLLLDGIHPQRSSAFTSIIFYFLATLLFQIFSDILSKTYIKKYLP